MLGKFTTKVSKQIQVSINIVGIRYRTSTGLEAVAADGGGAAIAN